MWIEFQNIHKHYGPVRANNGISLKVAPGTIHGILGENGAGKSTLMKILAGYIRKTDGNILINGAPAAYATPAQASRLGIGMLYQDPLDFPRLSALDNFMLGQSRGFIHRRFHFKDQFIRLCERLNFSLSPEATVSSLTVGERQQLEIIRLLSLGCRVLILDEPTSGISGVQREILFEALRKLTAEGKSIILVSHKLEDVEALCDRVSVLRQGVVTGEMDAPLDITALLEMMFDVPPVSPACRSASSDRELLALRGVSAAGGRTGLEPCDVVINRGEVVGLAGLEGSGQGVFLRVLCGLQAPQSGSVYLEGENVSRKGYHFFKAAGVRYMPASRLEEGLITDMNLTEHFALQQHAGSFWISWQEARQTAEKQIDRFHIKGKPETPVQSLSGGNQQRLLLSFLPENPQLLLLDNPTRGLDMESTQWVWQYLQTYCIHNTGIIFSSPELEEILTVAERVLVFFNGRIVKDVKTDDIDIHALGRAVAGKV
ncbi:MAG: sugar ABC transporter ATP-binding protein [Thermodesulfobacteriota bacterium]